MQTRIEIQENAVKEIQKRKGHCLLNLAPRVGKTKIAIDYLKSSNYEKILWVAPSSEIRDTDVPEEFIKWGAKKLLERVTIIHWASLNKTDCSQFDFIILDEYHMLTPSNTKTLVGRMLGLSGTHPVEEDKLEILSKLGLKICYKLSIDEAVKYNIVSPYTINVIEYNLDTKRNHTVKTKKGSFKNSEVNYYDYLTKRINQIRFAGKEVPFFMYLQRQRSLHTFDSRMEVARKVLSKFKEEDRSLIFTYTIEQAQNLCKYTYNSKTTNEDYKKFQNKEINKLALVNMASVGTTFRDMNNCLIVGTNSKAKNFEQKFCRVLIPRENYEAQIYLICALNTQDENWIQNAVGNLDRKNIKYLHYKNL